MDLLTGYLSLNRGFIRCSLQRRCRWSALAARPKVDGAFEDLGLHGPIALVIGDIGKRLVRGQIVEVGPQAIALGVDIGERPALQHLVV